MPDVYKMAIQSIAEVFAVVAILIGFANEEKIKAWEHRQWLKIAHRLHGLINRKTLNKPAPKKGRKRANIGDYEVLKQTTDTVDFAITEHSYKNEF